MGSEARPWRVLFDVEGVAFDPLPQVTAALRRALLRTGRPLPLEYDLSWIADVPLGVTLQRLAGPDRTAHEQVLRHLQHYYRGQSWRGCRRHPGVRAMLSRLRDLGAEVLVVSGHDANTAWRQAQALDLEPVVNGFVCMNQGGCPHVRQQLVTQLARESDGDYRIAWLTDLPPELMQARALGVIGIAAGWGRVPLSTLRSTRPPIVASKPAEVTLALELPQSWFDALRAPWAGSGDSRPGCPLR